MLIHFRSLVVLSRKLWDLRIPLIACRSIGFVGYVRVQVQEHTIVETHPDNEIPDLRLDKPFEGLKKHFDSIDLDSMDLKDHSHTPYVTILYKYLEKWRQTHDDIPKTYAEKEEFKEMIKNGIRKDENDFPMSEENFEEAIKAVNTCVCHTTVPSALKEVLNDNNCINLNEKVC